jgi:hypothetical protein
MATVSYWWVLRLPQVSELLAGTCLSRLADRMFMLAIVLYALQRFGSPAFTGWVAFAAFVPGLIASPFSGALLELGSVIGGWLVVYSLDVALIVAAMASLTAAIGAFLLIPVAGESSHSKGGPR